jgi:hypothetical protein
MNVLCSISTRGRYDTTLPMVLMSIVNQTKLPDCVTIFDDNDQPEDLREKEIYNYIFQIMDIKKIKWQVLYGAKKGQHFNHQIANKMGFDLVWRLDDDTVAEPNTLQILYSYITSENCQDVGAVAGSVLTPPVYFDINASGKIEDVRKEPNLQWDIVRAVKEVDHLHCSFLYRAGICDYNLALSRAAHREETLFTYAFRQKGYRLLLVPAAIVWHLKNSKGGIRTSSKEMFDHDEQIFSNIVGFQNTPVVLDCGLGDHVIFKRVLPKIKDPIVFSCYPEIIPGKSIADAIRIFGDISHFNVYGKMDQWKWKGSLEDAFCKLYGVEK